jgi:ethanolamine utilization protein EutA
MGADGSAPVGGRVFFSGADRSLLEEDEIRLTSVGIDIGSATSHMMLSEIVLERLDTRYIVASRKVLHASDILLTPYLAGGDIDAAALGAFFDAQFARAGVAREDIDTGALILTGVAVRRANARAIGTLFAAEAGRFVALSAGDRLESLMAAQGSGAVAASVGGRTVVNVDVGGGTTKIAVCRGGQVVALTAVEAGARLVVTDAADRITRIEEFGARTAAEAGLTLALGDVLDADARVRLGQAMAARIGRALEGTEPGEWLRLPPLPQGMRFDGVVFSGGVAEYIRGDAPEFGDLGRPLALALRDMAAGRGLDILPGGEGIRSTVIGVSQHSVQVSGSTLYLDPLDTLPLRNLPTVRPVLDLSGEAIDPDDVAARVRAALELADLADGTRGMAVAIGWQGSATYARLDGLARGLVEGLSLVLAQGHPLVVVCDGDIGGLLGMHCRENGMLPGAIVTIDGIALDNFDFIDIGGVLRATGAVPVVVKSLLFPSEIPPPEHPA